MELYRQYRPTLWKHLYGQDRAVATLRGYLKTGLPHTLGLFGPSGTGKTTAARILAKKMECEDFYELNAAKERGIGMVREIDDMMGYLSKCRMWVIDEAHRLTGDAQSAFLKMMEDSPEHVYFIFCTNHPQGLLQTIRTRCAKVEFESLDEDATRKSIEYVCDRTGINIASEKVWRAMISAANGSARQAIQILEAVSAHDKEQRQLDVIVGDPLEQVAIDLCRYITKGKPDLKGCFKILRSLKEDPEEIRRAVLGYCSTMILNNHPSSKILYRTLCAFAYNFYDSGKAGLVRAVWESCYEK